MFCEFVRTMKMISLMKTVMSLLLLKRVASTNLVKKEPNKHLSVGSKLLKVMLFAMTEEKCNYGFMVSSQDDRQNRD